MENPRRVRLEYDIDIFTPRGHTAWLTDRVDVGIKRTHYVGAEESDRGELVWYQSTFRSLIWMHRAALQRLEGRSLSELIQPPQGNLLLLHHRSERPVWSPEPGLDDVTVALIERNTTGLSQQELFLFIHDQELAGSVEA